MRLADERDTSAIRQALLDLQEYAKAYDFAVGVNFTLATSNLADAVADGRGYVIDGYLVLVDKVTPWYSTQSVLQEWLVLKLYSGGTTSSIPPALKQIAKSLGCVCVISGDSSPVHIMAKTYRDAGWPTLTQSFYKRVP